MDHGKYAALIEAAIEVERLSQNQEARTIAWQQLARDAKKGVVPREEIMQRRAALDSSVVVDFGGAIADLLLALRKLQR